MTTPTTGRDVTGIRPRERILRSRTCLKGRANCRRAGGSCGQAFRRFTLVALVVAVAVVAVSSGAAAVAAAKTFSVNSTADANICTAKNCTLRGAITAANTNSGTDTILFALQAGSVIKPKPALPTISDPVVIDGTSNSCSGTPKIVLNGSKIGGTASGLTVTAGSTTICGLVVQGFFGSGIVLIASGHDLIVDNYIGTNATGTDPWFNGTGIRVLSAGNTIGGTTPAARNVISGNQFGVDIGASATGNQVLGNYIGTNAAGTGPLAGGFGNTFGIHINSSLNTVGGEVGTTPGGACTGACNLISNNSDVGLMIQIGSANLVDGNYVGTNSAGTGAVPNGTGIYVAGPGNTLGGATAGARNVVSGNRGDGMNIFSTSNRVLGNYVGTTATGAAALGNNRGITDGGSSTTVGGVTTGSGNIISGNRRVGLQLSGTGAHTLGNYIGTNAAGTGALPNSTNGVEVTSPNNLVGGSDGTTPGGPCTGACNLISGNTLDGVDVGSTGNTVLGNFIGTKATGTAGLGNHRAGIFVLGDHNTIGGTTGTTPGGPCGGACNLVSANSADAIHVQGASASANRVLGNYIGTDAAGSSKLSNGQQGVTLLNAPNNTIGGVIAAARNLISGNGARGISISNVNSVTGNATGNQVLGNYIGTDATGTQALGNADLGIWVATANNTIGGTNGTTPGGPCTGACNIISGNGGGVAVTGNNATGNRVSENSIFRNGGLGIDLGANGVTPNGSGPTGPNHFQNFPDLSSATNDEGTTTVRGTLDGASGTTYHLEFFDSSVCDPSGNGEGSTYLGSLDNVTANTLFTFTASAAVGDVVTATATDINGNTSEFSPCVQVTASSGTGSTTVLVGDGGPPSVAPPHWVSSDGRYVVFNGTGGLTLGDTISHTTTLIPDAASGYVAGATVSDDGRYTAYLDGQGAAKLWDRTTDTSEVVSLTDDDQPALASFYGATVSGDGSSIVFLSCDPVLQPPNDCTGGNEGIFVRDRVAGTTTLINVTPGGSATGAAVAPSLSNDGGVAVWPGYLLDGPDAGISGIVVWKRATNQLSVIPSLGNLEWGINGPNVSGNGRYVAWSEAGSVFVHDLQANTTEEITPGTAGVPGVALVGVHISDDGRYLVFSTDTYDAYRYDRQTQTAIQINFDTQGTRGDTGTTGISGDGNKVAFDLQGTQQVLLSSVSP